MLYLVKKINLKKLCTDIIKSHDDITAISASYRTDFQHMTRSNVQNLYSHEEAEKSLADASLRWVTRRALRNLGAPLYAMAKYEKAKRITIPIGLYGMILCSTLPDSDAEKIADGIMQIINKYL